MDKKRKGLILSILGILGLIVITIGVTYAFFNYAKEGTTENSITSGTITFLYTEVSEVGRGIRIEDAYPMSDEIGKVQVGEGKVFDFKITSNTSSSTSIPYEVTARKKNGSTLDENVVKLYLTEVDGNLEEEVLLDNYSNLVQTTRVDSSRYIEKTIYEGRVPANSINYEKNFRLRMWIDENTDFGPIKGENGEDIYPYNGKEFTLTVNVYADADKTAEIKKFCKLKSGTAEMIGSKYECDPGDGVKRNFFILAINDDDSVNLIMEQNITQGSSQTTMTWNDAMKYFSNGEGVIYKNSWANVMNLDLPKAEDIANAVGKNDWTAEDRGLTWWCLGSKAQDIKSPPYCNADTNAQYNWLYNYTRECTDTGCDLSTSLGEGEAYGYWTKDLTYNTSYAWCVPRNGYLGRDVASNTDFGVRPVITVLKSNLYE